MELQNRTPLLCACPQVRPYLMADGGDVEVVDVENGYIFLRLQVRAGGCCDGPFHKTGGAQGGCIACAWQMHMEGSCVRPGPFT